MEIELSENAQNMMEVVKKNNANVDNRHNSQYNIVVNLNSAKCCLVYKVINHT